MVDSAGEQDNATVESGPPELHNTAVEPESQEEGSEATQAQRRIPWQTVWIAAGVVVALPTALVAAKAFFAPSNGSTPTSISTGVQTGTPRSWSKTLCAIPASPRPKTLGLGMCAIARTPTTNGSEVLTYPFGSIEVAVRVLNIGNKVLNNIVVHADLPKGIQLADHSSFVANDAAPEGAEISDHVSSRGVNLGNYAPRAAVYMKFDLRVDEPKNFVCGTNKSIVRVTASANNLVQNDDLVVSVVRKCPNKKGS